MKTLTLYTKTGCHLCDLMKQVIEDARSVHTFELVVRNIENDPADFEKYQYEIPVLLVDGIEAAKFRISSRKLAEALRD
jgi:glutaredoxin